MPYVTNEALRAFGDAFKQCIHRLEDGRVSIDMMCVRRLVRAQPDVAYREVELYCKLGQSQPLYLRTALTLAAAYQVEINDDTLVQMVMERARALGVEEQIQAGRVYADLSSAQTEPPERAAAKAWWQSSGRTEGHCDNCNRPLRRGEGYLIKGRSFLLGNQRLDLGEEIICQTCFHQLPQSSQ